MAKETTRDVQKSIRATPLPKLALRRSDLPGEWIALVEQLKEKDPSRRPSATDVACLLADMVRQEKKHRHPVLAKNSNGLVPCYLPVVVG
jgi:hypothetical protein